MALIETLIDNFDDNSINTTLWATATAGGTIQETNQQLWMTSDLNGGGNYFYSKTTYNLTGSSITVKIIDAGNQALSSWRFRPIWLWLSDANGIFWAIGDSAIRTNKIVSSANTEITNDAYDADTYRYLKIRESGGTVYWDYSANGISWTNKTSVATADLFAITALEQDFYISSSSEAETSTAKFDDCNVLPEAGGYTGQLMMVT